MDEQISPGAFYILLAAVFLGMLGLGIVIPPLIFGALLVIYGVHAIFIIAGIISLLTLAPFWWLVLRSKRLTARCGISEPSK